MPVSGHPGQKSPKANRAELIGSAATYAHEQVRTAKQHIEPIHVLSNSPIRRLAVSELPLDDQERMFDLASYGCFPVLNLPFPINPLIVLGNIQPGRFPADPKCDLGQMLIIFDFYKGKCRKYHDSF